ncbi:MAG TPA: cytochrome c [Chitinophagales bacterium]|nr:cytochrome c [Chitinophagales bacterium]HAE13388.1 hypothetical protein [Bacteroidota bacterium]HPE97565.1 cytochrome c [Chitinophagales bacterium]HQU39373.1 cytochrome c [Chitinophagales bacterium]HRX23991.1 cytochrome c [Chitinophagales bacterium]
MKKVLKWIGIIILVLVVIIVAAMFMFRSKYKSLANERFEVNVPDIALQTDSAGMARGEMLATALCTGCHGGDLAGKDFFNDKTIGVVYSANLTPGGPTAAWSTEDFVRAIRYGVRPDGSGLFIMPSLEYNHMSDYDLGCLIAYLRSLPASDNPSPPAEFTFMAQVMAGAGLFGDLYSASVLDLQDGSARERPEVGETLAYGEYVMLISGCQSCHGEAFNGAKSPDPVSPPGGNITPAGNIGNWNYDQFAETMWTGKTPEGKEMDPKFMPWDGIRLLGDTEKKALFLYLQNLPPKEDSEDLARWKEKNS